MSILAYIIARDLININKSEYSPKKTHLFKETSRFEIMSHNLNSIRVEGGAKIFGVFRVKNHEQYCCVFKTHRPPSTISHLYYIISLSH